ncbi:peptidase S8 [Waterburya agarophytonicola K14]|uniref:Peptidase S8 n=1 Tax=Waterburya agarophytonicola KI4 TaxID=2874699 RepID=A0A964BMJ3_9CYAN|nr:S8 family peptidase [Waterburya agarophytonicola]MCC0176100.1 peptidase S8 [Waterburya agarophytonicola KI4]
MKKLVLLCLFVLGLGFSLLSFKGLAQQGEFNSIILDFKEEVPIATISDEIKGLSDKYNQQVNLNSVFSISDRIYIVEGDKKTLKELKKSPLNKDTEYIEANYLYHALEVPNDPEYSKQWNFRNINLEKAWDETKGGGITVAVIDTGVSKVPDLKLTKFVKGYDFVNDKDDAGDDQGHGTHVAGTIAQSTNNGYGVAGIAYESNIMPLKVLAASGGGTIADIAEAIKFAADNGADVINMSLGGGGASSMMEEAIKYAHNKGVVIVAAAGNENRNASSYPARYPDVISVSAIDSAGAKAPYSNFGAAVDISAPGGSETGKIIQNTVDPRTGESVFVGFQGTSMAAPHVAGVAALIRATGIDSPDQVRDILKQSSRKVQEDSLNHFGSGYLDAGAAVELALKGKITFNDFFRWLRKSGYLNLGFWIDGGAVALLPKLGMVIGSYLLAWFLRNYLPFTLGLNGGLIFGSSGLFFLQGLYWFDLPQWPMRLAGSSIPELGNVVLGNSSLNPLFASVLIPLGLIILLIGNPRLKWFAIGSSIGVAACLAVTAFTEPNLWLFGTGLFAQGYLLINACLCVGLAYIASQKETQRA